MYPFRRNELVAWVIALVSTLAISACATTNVGSYLGRDAELSKYHTYSWAAADQFETGDPRLDNNRFFQDRLRTAVEKQLVTRGFEQVGSTKPELILHYHVNVRQQIDAGDIDQKYGYCNECLPYVYDVYDAGTLVIDFVDARTNRLVWRGWAEGSIEGVIDDQRAMEGQIDKAVAVIMKKLPRLS
jgi:hypothetical protein